MENINHPNVTMMTPEENKIFVLLRLKGYSARSAEGIIGVFRRVPEWRKGFSIDDNEHPNTIDLFNQFAESPESKIFENFYNALINRIK